MTIPKRWTEDEVKLALYLYLQLPFGQIHSGNPEVIALAEYLGRTPSSVAMKLANLASLDPKITSSGRKGLEGASSLDRKVWAQFNDDWTGLVTEAEALATPSSSNRQTVKDNAPSFTYEPYVGQSTVIALAEKRMGQDFFRRAVLANYDNICCMTGIADARLLNASHIVPWSKDVQNRHNPKNGLCLSATFDRAFDRGLMTVDDAGRAIFSANLLDSDSSSTRAFFRPYNGKPLISPARFDPDPSFLRWHRENCFEGAIN